MRKLLFASAALGALTIGLATTATQAAPIVGGLAVAQAAPSLIENVFWRRYCGPYRCHWVWVRPRWWWR